MSKEKYNGVWDFIIPVNTFNGTLHYDSNHMIELEIWGENQDGAFWDFDLVNVEKHDIVNGITTHGKQVTLINLVRTGFNGGSSGLYTKRYSASYLIFGHHFKSIEELQFNSYLIDYQYVWKWITDSGFQSQFNGHNRSSNDGIFFKTEYRFPNGKLIETEDINISVNYYFKSEQVGTKMILDEKKPLKIQTSQNMHLFDFIKKTDYELRTFFSFLTGKPIYHNSFIVERSDIERFDLLGKSMGLKQIEVCFVLRNQRDEVDEQTFNMPFRYNKIKDSLSSLFTNWHLCFTNFNPLLRIYFKILYDNENNIDINFLNYMQGLESYFRYRYGDNYMSKETFSTVSNNIVSYIKELQLTVDEFSKDQLDSMSNAIKYSNEYSLRKKVKLFWDEHPKFMELHLGGKRDFVKLTVGLRNHLTHYAEDAVSEKLTHLDKLNLVEQLRFCIQIILLRELGYSNDEIEQMSTEHSFYKINKYY